MSMIGKSLAHYEITGEIGKGGMGEVYQARDRKLGRDVAIKVLPEEFARDHDRVVRFQREAKLLASLNHPNIASIYGLEESGGTHFLVMELIEGTSLADQIKSGPIPAEEALKLALQIAEALEAAHEKGVIHRDLKPANIKVTPEGKAKVLDFGLAKAFEGSSENMNLSNSPTLSDAATMQGVILGTAAYMPPEQAKGKTVDKRADVWAFGVVLFEMLSGRQQFRGETVSETLASVIKSDPEWGSLPLNLHPRIRLLLERCLKKDPKDRYSAISDARVDIREVLDDPGGVYARPGEGAASKGKLKTVLPWIAATAVLCLIIAGVAVWKLKPAEPRKVMRFTYELPEGQQFTQDILLAVSPDGSRFAYATTGGIYLRAIDALDARLVASKDGDFMQPFFSPDGKWIGYWSSAERKVKKIAVSGGVPVVLCDTGILVVGLSWGEDNTIVFADVMGGGVKRVSADGGTAETIVKADMAAMVTEGIPVMPRILPDGKTLLFSNAFSAQDSSSRQIAIQSLETNERKVLIGGTDAWYIPTGHLVVNQVNNNQRSIAAVPFDLDTLEVKGGPVPLLEGVGGSDLSSSGTLVYVSQPQGSGDQGDTAGAADAAARKMVWVDLKGRETPINMPPRVYRYPKISPDGTKVALTATVNNNTDIWIWDLARETLTPLTFDKGIDMMPIWSPNGKRIAFHSIRESSIQQGGVNGGIYCKTADGTGEEETLCLGTENRIIPMCWSRDGNTLLITKFIGNGMENQDIVMLSMKDDHEVKPLLQENYMELQPQISPDGKWLVYCSNESGENEIWVRPFPDVNGGRWQVSTNGGNSPLWSPDSRTIYYMIGNTEGVMAVDVATEPAIKLGKPRLLFKGDYVGPVPSDGVPWDIHPDGKRFFMMKPPGTPAGAAEAEGPQAAIPQPKITIVLNWDEELKARVPAP